MGLRPTILLIFCILISCSERKTYSLYVCFGNVEGLKKGDAVVSGDMRAGRVNDVFWYKGKVFAALEMENDTEIPLGSKFILKDDLKKGGKYIEIIPGSFKSIYADGDTLTGYDHHIIPFGDRIFAADSMTLTEMQLYVDSLEKQLFQLRKILDTIRKDSMILNYSGVE